MLTHRNFSLWLRDQSSWGQGPDIWILKSPQRLPLSPCRAGGQPLRVDGGSLDTTGLWVGGKVSEKTQEKLGLKL